MTGRIDRSSEGEHINENSNDALLTRAALQCQTDAVHLQLSSENQLEDKQHWVFGCGRLHWLSILFSWGKENGQQSGVH